MYLSIYLSLYLFIHLCIILSVYLSIHPPIHPSQAYLVDSTIEARKCLAGDDAVPPAGAVELLGDHGVDDGRPTTKIGQQPDTLLMLDHVLRVKQLADQFANHVGVADAGVRQALCRSPALGTISVLDHIFQDLSCLQTNLSHFLLHFSSHYCEIRHLLFTLH